MNGLNSAHGLRHASHLHVASTGAHADAAAIHLTPRGSVDVDLRAEDVAEGGEQLVQHRHIRLGW